MNEKNAKEEKKGNVNHHSIPERYSWMNESINRIWLVDFVCLSKLIDWLIEFNQLRTKTLLFFVTKISINKFIANIKIWWNFLIFDISDSFFPTDYPEKIFNWNFFSPHQIKLIQTNFFSFSCFFFDRH